MLSRFAPSKDQLTLCRSVKILKQELKIDINLILCGNYHTREGLEVINYITENNLTDIIILVGEITNINDFFININIYIGSSINETFGLSLLEAMSRKFPVLASDIPAHTELLDNGKYGMLFKLYDEIDLVEKIKLMIHNNNIQKYSKLAFERSLKFDIKNTVSEFEKLYLSLI